ncbi:24245_t:CDS:2, partial [Racocetra persica]
MSNFHQESTSINMHYVEEKDNRPLPPIPNKPYGQDSEMQDDDPNVYPIENIVLDIANETQAINTGLDDGNRIGRNNLNSNVKQRIKVQKIRNCVRVCFCWCTFVMDLVNAYTVANHYIGVNITDTPYFGWIIAFVILALVSSFGT